MDYLADGVVPSMLDTVGVDVTVGADSVKAIARQVDVETQTGEGGDVVISQETIFTVRTKDVTVEPGTTVTRGDETYQVREHRQFAGGALSHLYCYRVIL